MLLETMETAEGKLHMYYCSHVTGDLDSSGEMAIEKIFIDAFHIGRLQVKDCKKQRHELQGNLIIVLVGLLSIVELAKYLRGKHFEESTIAYLRAVWAKKVDFQHEKINEEHFLCKQIPLLREAVRLYKSSEHKKRGYCLTLSESFSLLFYTCRDVSSWVRQRPMDHSVTERLKRHLLDIRSEDFDLHSFTPWLLEMTSAVNKLHLVELKLGMKSTRPIYSGISKPLRAGCVTGWLSNHLPGLTSATSDIRVAKMFSDTTQEGKPYTILQFHESVLLSLEYPNASISWLQVS